MKKMSIILMLMLTTCFASAAVNCWTAGDGTSDWATDLNWSTGYVPFLESGHAHVIPNGTHPMPIISSAGP